MDDSPQSAREILEAAFDDAFAPPERPPSGSDTPAVPQPTAARTASATSAEPSLATSTSADDDDDSWKEVYETQVRAWRAQSAEQREKAEKERLRWETIREKEEANQRKSSSVPSVQESWEKFGPSASSVTATIVSHTMEDRSKADPPTQEGTPDDIQKWENVPSMASSFPSIVPDTQALSQLATQPQPTPTSVTLSIFDSSLSTRTRILAVASSLAMNLLLPFINGVMLGFGEIFARRVVTGWVGRNVPAVNVGVGANSWKGKIFS